MATFISRQNWFIRYKLYHIPFWMLYNYVLWALYVGSPYEAAREQYFSTFWVKCFFYTIFPAFAVYFNLYFLIPRYLQKGHYSLYLFFLVLIIIASSMLIVPGYYLTAWLDGTNAERKFGITTDWNGIYTAARSEPLKSTIAAITLGMSIKLTKNWLETQRRHQALEKEKLETELKFLKYQFNPHFLFNSINSIFFLIHKNPDMASESLAKFSELLRYQLYECNDQQIALSKEIAYLENFIELEKLRQNKVTVTMDIDEQHAQHLDIAPFILMTFVENAFKHVSKYADQPNWIDIKLSVDQYQLDFVISNSTSTDKSTDVVNYGGIGLKNVQRRLELVYPGKYELRIEKDNDRFEVKLQLMLSEPVLSPAMQMV